jgi:hypothetical protein
VTATEHPQSYKFSANLLQVIHKHRKSNQQKSFGNFPSVAMEEYDDVSELVVGETWRLAPNDTFDPALCGNLTEDYTQVKITLIRPKGANLPHHTQMCGLL